MGAPFREILYNIARFAPFWESLDRRGGLVFVEL